MQIIGIVNSEKDNLIRTKIPSSIMSSCIYYIVDEPLEYETGIIIATKMKNSIPLSVKTYLENEIKDLFSTYLKVSNILKENESEEKITLHDINKYIVFREISDERVEKEIIKHFIFYSKFYNDNIKERIKRELGFYSFKSNPIFSYDGNKHSLLINFSDEKSKKNSFQLTFKLNEEDENNETNISHINNIQEELSTLTQSEKFCFIFLALSVKTMESMKLNRNSTKLGDRVCIKQGEISYKVLGKKLIIYQMNSDSILFIFLNQSILSNQLKENEYFELKEKFDKKLNSFKN